MTTWILLYYVCWLATGCWHYVPVDGLSHADCVEQAREYRRTQIRYLRRMGLGDGDAVCIPTGSET